jgi:poly(3-hydroxyoctanoate) depolymerase
VHEYIEVDGLRLRASKTGSGPPLLLINGLSSRIETWRVLLEAMHGRTIISYDAPGIGESATPCFPLSMGKLARIAEGVLDAVSVGAADVLGYSHGGAVAQQFAFDNPTRINRMVLAATSCGVGSMLGDPLSVFERVAAQWRHTIDDGARAVATPLGLLWQIFAIGTWTSSPWLDQITTETLVLAGSDDRFVPPGNGRFLAARIPNSRYRELPGAGHELFNEPTAAVVAAEIAAFLGDN